MQDKRGQVTLFIIIAIVLVCVIALFFLFKDELLSGAKVTNEPVYLFVETCIGDISEDAVYFIGQGGGYFYAPEKSTSEGIPYYYYEGEDYVPSINEIEKGFSDYVEISLPYCINEFENFPDFNISSGEISVDVEIKTDEIILNVDYPIFAEKEDSKVEIKSFKDISTKAPLGKIHNLIGEMINEEFIGEQICLSCISEIAEEESFVLDMQGIEEGTIFTFRDNDFEIKGVALEFKFASKTS